MSTPTAYDARPRTSPRPRYLTCPHCRHVVGTHWRHDYCQRCFRTFATGRYDKTR